MACLQEQVDCPTRQAARVAEFERRVALARVRRAQHVDALRNKARSARPKAAHPAKQSPQPQCPVPVGLQQDVASTSSRGDDMPEQQVLLHSCAKGLWQQDDVLQDGNAVDKSTDMSQAMLIDMSQAIGSTAQQSAAQMHSDCPPSRGVLQHHTPQLNPEAAARKLQRWWRLQQRRNGTMHCMARIYVTSGLPFPCARGQVLNMDASTEVLLRLWDTGAGASSWVTVGPPAISPDVSLADAAGMSGEIPPAGPQLEQGLCSAALSTGRAFGGAGSAPVAVANAAAPLHVASVPRAVHHRAVSCPSAMTVHGAPSALHGRKALEKGIPASLHQRTVSDRLQCMAFDQLAALLALPQILERASSMLQRLQQQLLRSQSPAVREGLWDVGTLLWRLSVRPSLTSPRSKLNAAHRQQHSKGNAHHNRCRSMPAAVAASSEAEASGARGQPRYPVRTFLSAYLMVLHPDVVCNRPGQSHGSVVAAAGEMLERFEAVLRVLLQQGTQCTRPLVQLLLRFDEAWVKFLTLFVAWKDADAASIEDDLVRMAVNMEVSLRRKLGPSGEDSMRVACSPDLQAMIAQVAHDHALMEERVRKLSGAEGVSRMKKALERARQATKEQFANAAGAPAAVLLAAEE